MPNEDSHYRRGPYNPRTGNPAPKKYLKVSFPDGTVIVEDMIRITYERTIEKIGPAKAAICLGKIKRYYAPLMSQKEEDYAECSKPKEISILSDGWRLLTVGSVECKADYLKKMSDELNLNLVVEVIEKKKSGC